MVRAETSPDTVLCCGETYTDPNYPMVLYVSGDDGRTWTRTRITAAGGCGYALAVDRRDSRMIFVGGKDKGKAALFVSKDGGIRWESIAGSIKGTIVDLALDPRTSRTIYAGTAKGLYRSTNGGGAWERRAVWDIRAIAVDPVSPDRVWAGGGDGLFVSVDGGTTWASVPGLTVDSVTCLKYGAKTKTLYVGTDGGGILASAGE
jgi:photosystem II stability/assembly factor-like uncharacterized protein